MDVLDRLLAHDAWTTRQVLDRARELSADELEENLGIGPGGVRPTLDHVIWNMEAWRDALEGQPLRERPAGDDALSLDCLSARLAAAETALASTARRIRDEGRADEPWTDPRTGKRTEVTLGGVLAHVVTHGMHHRAQVFYMLRRHGLTALPEGDVLSWEEHFRSGDA
ncbi:MAG TPA: DinB family protein [Longimicrobiaceae bacterium]|jgi:uncharacterized damage-inducible protein DinB|nr:DinB family protein [Longimicrobiaceae bacterium]